MRWNRGVTIALAGYAAVASAQAADADENMLRALDSRVADAVAVLRGERAQEEVFTPEFTAAVPASQLHELADRLVAENGAIGGSADLVKVGPWGGRFTVLFERARASATIQLEPASPHRIAGLFIGPPTPLGDTGERIAADFAALPGRAGFAVTRLGRGQPEVIAGRLADQSFAIGSTFKLWVLEALAEDIRLGKRRWADVVALGPPSLPSGITQNWPAGSPVTLETLATLMISQSDNTATDTLIRLLGRRAIERRLALTGHSNPRRMTPFLTTLEAFALKVASESERARWNTATPSERRAILLRLNPRVERIDRAALDKGHPNDIETVEWFASPLDVVRVLDALRRNPDPRLRAILAVSPALPAERRERLRYAGYKGGSETGVIALNWLLQSRSGAWYAVTASWNDPRKAVNEASFAMLALRLIDKLD